MPSQSKSSLLFRFSRRPAAIVICSLALATASCKDEQHEAGDQSHGGDPSHAGHRHADEHADEVTLSPEAIRRYGVKVETAARRVLTPTFVCPARIAFNAEAMAHIGSPLRGRAVEIKARLGDHVTKDQDLVIIESPDLGEAQSDFLQKRAAAHGAGPQEELAKAAWDRAKGLYEQSQGISLTEVQRREAEHKGAVAARRAAESAARAAENRLRLLGIDLKTVESLAGSGDVSPRFIIRAPIDGQVIHRDVTQGEQVGPEGGREALFVLADTRTLWVLADCPEAHLAEVAPGARAWISVGIVAGEESVGKEGGGRLEASVSFISPFVDPTTRSAQVRIEVPGGEGAGGAGLLLRPGMFAQAEIASAARDRADAPAVVAIPEAAVQLVEGGPAVFVPVEGEPNTFAKRAVTVGPAVGGLVPVHSGLSEGEEYVATGSFILKADLGKGTAKHEH